MLLSAAIDKRPAARLGRGRDYVLTADRGDNDGWVARCVRDVRRERGL